jgi:hypothetical protein
MDEKPRRDFLKDAALLAAVPFLSIKALTGSDFKIVEWKPIDLADGQLFTGTMLINGKEARAHILRVEEKETYSIFARVVLPGKTLSQFIAGTKGEQQGDRRLDTLRVTRFEADGTAIQQIPQVVGVVTSHPYAGLPPDEMLKQFQADKAAGRW